MIRRAAAVLIMLVAGCRDEVTMLSHDDLAALLSEDRHIAFQRSGVKGTARLNADFTFDVLVPRLGQDSGVWWLEGDRICSQWEDFRAGRPQCAVVGQLGDGTYRGYSPKPQVYLGDFSISK